MEWKKISEANKDGNYFLIWLNWGFPQWAAHDGAQHWVCSDGDMFHERNVEYWLNYVPPKREDRLLMDGDREYTRLDYEPPEPEIENG